MNRRELYLLGLGCGGILLCSSCDEKQLKPSGVALEGGIDLGDFSGHLRREDVPLEMLDLEALSSKEVFLQGGGVQCDIGVIVSNGVEMMERYRSPVIELMNGDHQEEVLATSYAAFREFTALPEGGLRLVVTNRSSESVRVLLYKSAPSN